MIIRDLRQALREKITQLGWSRFISVVIIHTLLLAVLIVMGVFVLYFTISVINNAPNGCVRSVC